MEFCIIVQNKYYICNASKFGCNQTCFFKKYNIKVTQCKKWYLFCSTCRDYVYIIIKYNHMNWKIQYIIAPTHCHLGTEYNRWINWVKTSRLSIVFEAEKWCLTCVTTLTDFCSTLYRWARLPQSKIYVRVHSWAEQKLLASLAWSGWIWYTEQVGLFGV